MKKMLRNIGTFFVIALVSVAILMLLVLINSGFNAVKEIPSRLATEKELQSVMILGLFAIMILLSLIYFFGKLILTIHNKLENADDGLFLTIDNWRRIRDKSNLHYDIGISTINTLYDKDGVVCELVKNKNGDRLLKRKEYLLNQLNFLDETHQCILAIFQSMIAALILENFKDQVGILSCLVRILLVLFILAMPFAKYSGYIQRLGRHEKAILEYEMNKLDEYIDEYNMQKTLSENEKKLLNTQEIVILELVDRKRNTRGKHRKEIKKDIELVQGLDLLSFDSQNCYYVESNVGARKVTLVYRLPEDEGSKKQKPRIPINTPHSELRKIMDKYSML